MSIDQKIERYMIVLKHRQWRDDESGLNRKEKYDMLKRYYFKYWGMVMSYITEHDLSGEVSNLDSPTSFNFLFISCTERVAKILCDLEYVENVHSDVEVELIR